MCGICGFVGGSSFRSESDLDSIIWRMTNSIGHRGPDDAGVWVDAQCALAFGHRRLAILDLSPSGHQPMNSQSGRFVIVFNGEIYNHLDLRRQLESSGHSFHGSSDTEVILASIEEWGVEGAAPKFIGMFAMAIWDRTEKALVLIRDRLGEKPLYYGWLGDCFAFASELKSMCCHPSWKGIIDRHSLALFMRHNYVPAPRSIYTGVFKLLPGTILRLSRQAVVDCETPCPAPYWSLRHAIFKASEQPFLGSARDAQSELQRLLKASVARQMISDVPIGAFLSGGIDSSTIVAVMQSLSSRPIRTFTIGFEDSEFNEAPYAAKVANYLGTDHSELRITHKDALDVIPALPALYDEPFSDSSQIPTFLVSQFARNSVTVSLSGDAGDELFGGYPRYFEVRKLLNVMNRLPHFLAQFCSSSIEWIPTKVWDGIASSLPQTMLPKRIRGRVGDQLHKLASVLRARKADQIYFSLITHWQESNVVLGLDGSSDRLDRMRNVCGIAADSGVSSLTDNCDNHDFKDWLRLLLNGSDGRRCSRGKCDAGEEWMMALDTLSYLPDDILVKVDRAAMAVGLETRVPLLDHNIVEFAWRLPMKFKMRGNQGKWILRNLLNEYVPRHITDRRKMGFGVPLASWLRGPLRDWAEDLLDETRLHKEGFLDASLIRKSWKEHLSGVRQWHFQLWDVLMFQSWFQNIRSPQNNL